MARLTHQNKLLCSTRYYKLKYTPFNNPMNYEEIRYVWTDRCLPPDTPLHDRLWGIRTIKNEHV